MCCHCTPLLLQQVAAELITEDSGFSISEAFAAAGPFDHVYSHPASAHAPSRLGAPQQASPAYPALLCSYPTDPDMEVAAAAAAAGDSDSQETGQDAAAGEEGDGVERSAEPAGRSHRARRATEKALALQSRVRRSRTSRKAAGGEVWTAACRAQDWMIALIASCALVTVLLRHCLTVLACCAVRCCLAGMLLIMHMSVATCAQ